MFYVLPIRVYISCWYKMKKEPANLKNSLPLKRKKESFFFQFLKRAIHFQTGLSTQASNHPGCDKPPCQYSPAWFGHQTASQFFPDSTQNLKSVFSEYICILGVVVSWAKKWEYRLMGHRKHWVTVYILARMYIVWDNYQQWYMNIQYFICYL